MVLMETLNVSKKFGNITALENMSLSFNRGVYGLVGPNGSGKTTLIRIILGLQKPSSGRVLVFGRDPFRSHGEVCSRIGYLREKCSFPKWTTGIEYLKHVARLKQVDLDRDIINHAIIKGDFLQRKIGTYSAGMVQRLGLLQALVGSPSLIILDEPSTNLDPIGRVEMVQLIKEIKRDEKTIIISTHVLEELEQICDFIVIMKNSRIIVKDSLKQFVKCFSSDGTLSNAYLRIMRGA